MEISAKGLELIKHFESLKLKPYLCSASVPTIGYGSTKYEDGRKVKMTDKAITKERAERLLLNTVVVYEAVVKKEFKGVGLTQEMYDGLVSFAYNTGGFKYNHGKSTYTFASYIKSDMDDYKFKKDVVDFMMSVSKYYDVNSKSYKTASGLRRRRMSELILMYTGQLVYYANGSWDADKVSTNYAKDTGRKVYQMLGLL
jgi:lysozyme